MTSKKLSLYLPEQQTNSSGVEDEKSTVTLLSEIELKHISQEAQLLDDDIDTLGEVIVGLEQLVSQLHETDAFESGLPDTANVYVSHSLEAYNQQLGGEIDVKITLESFVENIKKIWRAILEAIKRVYNAVKDFFRKIFSNIKALRKKLEATKREIETKKGKPQGKMLVPRPNMIAYRDISNDYVSVKPKDIHKGLVNFNSLLYYLTDIYINAAIGDLVGAANMVDKIKRKEDSIIENIESYFTPSRYDSGYMGIRSLFSKVTSDNRRLIEKVHDYPDRFNQLLGGAYITTQLIDVGASYAILKLEYKRDSDVHRSLNTTAIQVPERNELLEIINEAIKLTETIVNSEEKVKLGLERYKQFRAMGKTLFGSTKFIDGVGKDLNPANAVVSRITPLARFYSRDLFGPVHKSCAHIWSVCSSIDDLARVSLKNYK